MAVKIRAVVVAMALMSACTSRTQTEVELPDVLRIAIRQPSTLDPASLRDPAGLLIARQIFEPLVRIDNRTLDVKPALAQSWQSLDGGTRYVFKLRNAKFHNGRNVTSEDVRFALNRLARKDTGSEVAFLLETVVGFPAVNGTGTATELEGVKSLDERTIEIRLSLPWVEFPYVLSHPSTSAIPRQEFESNPAGFKDAPIGSGPYRVLPAPQRQDFSLVRFNGYWGTKPKINKVDLLIYEQVSGAWRDFEKNELHVVEVPPGQISRARSRYGDRGFGPVAAGIYIGFNLKRFPDVRLRQAVSLALDRDEISHSIYDDTLRPSQGIVPEGLSGRDPEACAEFCERDLTRAKVLIKEAFPQGPPEIKFNYQQGPPHDAVARSLQQSLAEIGIKLIPQPQELGSFFDTLDKEEQDIFRLGWVAEYPLADWFIEPLFRSGSPDNHTGYAVPEVDELMKQARSAPDRRNRQRLYRSLESRLTRELALIPVGHFRNHYAAQRFVHGFYVDQVGGFEIAKLEFRAAPDN